MFRSWWLMTLRSWCDQSLLKNSYHASKSIKSFLLIILITYPINNKWTKQHVLPKQSFTRHINIKNQIFVYCSLILFSFFEKCTCNVTFSTYKRCTFMHNFLWWYRHVSVYLVWTAWKCRYLYDCSCLIHTQFILENNCHLTDLTISQQVVSR